MEIFTPFDDGVLGNLRAGDEVLLTGDVYTARDAAHARMFDALKNGQAPPFPYAGNAVFYAGPSATPPNRAVGSIGPTTSGRMDAYAPALIEAGLKVMIGKGERSAAVIDFVMSNFGIYFIMVGGIAALTAKRVTAAEVVAYGDLGAEAVRKLSVEKLPLIVAVDSLGNCVYNRG